MRNTLVPRMLAALVSVAFGGSASAAGFQLLEQNASGLGNAYAGSAAVAENASTIFYNPAGMTQLQDREVSVGVAAVKPSFRFSNNGSVVANAGAASLSGNGGDGGALAFLPNAYMSWALSKDLYAGLGLGAPFGLMTEYDNTWLGAAQSVRFDIKTYNINPSLAYRVNERVSVGAGVSYMIMEAEYVKRYVGPGATIPTRLNPLATLKADSNAIGWNLGMLVKLSPDTRLGLSYRSRVRQNLEGDLTVATSPATRFAARAELSLPDTAILSLAHKLDSRWELLGDLSWTGWSSIPKVDIVRSADGAVLQRLDTAFKDGWRLALGANYQLNDATRLKFGVAHDQSPVPDAERRLVSLPDNDRTWLSVGLQWKTGKGATVDLGAARLFISNTPINNNGGATGTITGNYSSSVWIVGAQYSQAF